MLIGNDGILKLADFGFARMYEDYTTPMTPRAVTLWYRCPELLLGAAHYGPSIDLWSVGCVFAELMLRVPYFAAESELEQLTKIFEAMGTPTEKDWPGLTELCNGIQFKQYPRPQLASLFTAAGDDTLDLLSKLLMYDPRRRLSAKDALGHPYFVNSPRPTVPEELPKSQGDYLHPHVKTEPAGQSKKRDAADLLSQRKGKQLKFEE